MENEYINATTPMRYQCICGNQCKITYEGLRYGRHGCVDCRNEMANINRKKTFMEKYGVENPSQCEIIKNKRSATNLSKYGSICPISNPIIKAKAIETLQNNYGVNHNSHSKIIMDKAKITLLNRYGVTNASHSKEL